MPTLTSSSYLMIASLVGLYSVPYFARLRPVVRETTTTKVSRWHRIWPDVYWGLGALYYRLACTMLVTKPPALRGILFWNTVLARVNISYQHRQTTVKPRLCQFFLLFKPSRLRRTHDCPRKTSCRLNATRTSRFLTATRFSRACILRQHSTISLMKT